MRVRTFELYRFENLIKTTMLYVQEDPENKTYKIKVEGDNIEEILDRIYLPDRLKQEMRYDIVNIVKGFNMFAVGRPYNDETKDLCNSYFRDMFTKFCMVHGSYYKFKEDEITI
jgi:hypothetical protein